MTRVQDGEKYPTLDETNAPKFDRRERWRAALLFAIIVVAAFPQVVFFGRSLVATDQYNPLTQNYTVESKGPDFVPVWQWHKRGLLETANFHDSGSAWWQSEPGLHFFRRAILSGEFPFWDRTAAAGVPAYTNLIPSFLFPPQIALSLGGATSGQKNAYILLFFWASAFGTYCVLRLHGVGRPGSAAAALIFLFSGAVQRIGPITFMAQAVVCLPFLILVTRWFTDKPSWPRTAALASIYAVASLASFPPILVPAFILSVLYFGCAVALEKRTSRRLLITRFLAGAALSLGLAAAYYLPAIVTISQAHHATESYRHAGLGFLPARALFGLLSATATGGAGIYFDPIAPALPGGLFYLGVTGLFLAVFAMGKSDRSRPALLALTCGGCALLILLKVFGVPPVQWIALLPGFQNLHYSYYLGIPLAFLIAVLGGVGLERLLRKEVGIWSLLAASGLLGAVLISLWLFARGTGNLSQPGAGRWMRDYGLLILFFALALGVTGLAYFRRPGAWGRVAPWPLLVLLFAEGVVNATYPRQRRWDVFAHPPAYVSFLQKMEPPARGFQIEALRANLGSAFGIEQLESLYAFCSTRVHELYVTYAGSKDPLFLRQASKLPPEPVLDRAGVGWVMVNPHLNSLVAAVAGRHYPLIFEQGEIKIFGRGTAQRYLFSSQYQVTDRTSALQRIATAPPREIVLEESPPFPSFPNPADDPAPELISARLNSLELSIRAPRPGLLYVADAWAEGWSATVNGETAPIFVANYAFRAVSIPEGDVRVRFSYRPVGFVPGAAISLLSLGLVCALALRKNRGGTNSDSTPQSAL